MGFTGKVCKDVQSCMGDSACKDANIPIVVKSCKDEKACISVGLNVDEYGTVLGANKVGNFINSCIGYRSCYQVAFGTGGSVGDLDVSCIGEDACFDMGRDLEGGLGGPVTSNLKDCCATARACYQFGEADIPNTCKVVSFSSASIPRGFYYCRLSS